MLLLKVDSIAGSGILLPTMPHLRSESENYSPWPDFSTRPACPLSSENEILDYESID